MNLKNIKRNTALKFIKKNNKRTVDLQDKSMVNIKNVGIIVAEDLIKTYDFTRKLSQQLHVDQNYFDQLIFIDRKDKNNDNSNVFSDKSLAHQAKLKGDDLNRFINKDLDLLINYCHESNVTAQLVAFKSKAKIKVGFFQEEENFYDLSIVLEDNKIDMFNEEIVKYLQILKFIK